jgi:hypothetical protein
VLAIYYSYDYFTSECRRCAPPRRLNGNRFWQGMAAAADDAPVGAAAAVVDWVGFSQAVAELLGSEEGSAEREELLTRGVELGPANRCEHTGPAPPSG